MGEKIQLLSNFSNREDNVTTPSYNANDKMGLPLNFS